MLYPSCYVHASIQFWPGVQCVYNYEIEIANMSTLAVIEQGEGEVHVHVWCSQRHSYNSLKH